MRTSDTPFIADWFSISLRWLVLIGLVVALALGGGLMSTPTLLLAGLALWNIALTILAGLDIHFRFQRHASLAVDLLFACLYFGLSRGFLDPASWIGLLPLLTAALFFELRGAWIAAGVLVLGQVGATLLRMRTSQDWLFLGLSALLAFLFASLFGFLSQRTMRSIRRTQQARLSSQQKKERLEDERLRAIYDLTSTLTATLNYQRVLDTALDLSLSALNPDPGAQPDDRLIPIALLFNPQEVLEVGSARRLTPADARITLPGAEGILAKVIEGGEPVLITDVGHDPELGRVVALHNCVEAYCFPLRSGFNVFGVLIYGHPEAGYFASDRREVIDIIGRQAVIAIHNARLYQDLVDERNHMIEVQEEARKKLARDLHDGPTQSVAAMAMRVNLARRMLTSNPQAVGEELGKIEDLARRTTKEIRHMLFTLRPLVLESQGLAASLQAMAEKMNETYAQNVIINVDENVLKDMELGKQGVIFYLVEEALNNARKHAQAKHVWVRLRPLEQSIALLEIQDDGVGFDVEAVMRAYDKRGSLGMINLRERTELVNGLLNLKSEPGKGTVVQVFIPLTEEAADRMHHAAGKR